MNRVRNFASDNNSGACPEALERCNRDDAEGYGEDLWTKRVSCVYTFIGKGGCRFMCSWDTTNEDITDLISDLRELMGK